MKRRTVARLGGSARRIIGISHVPLVLRVATVRSPSETPAMDLELAGKLALVTGSTAGIGLAVVEGLAAEGARVIVNGRTGARVDAALETIRRSHPDAQLEALVGDLATADGAAEATRQFPDVDVLVNNLGVYEPKPFEDITDEDWTAIIETNFLSGVRLSRHYLPRMKARDWGRVLFVSSESGVNIPVEMIHYGVTKTMQIALARGLAETCAGTNVTVNSVLVGPTRSEGVEKFLVTVAEQRKIPLEQVEREFFATLRPTSLLGRFATPTEVAALVVFAASPRATITNGAAIRAEGGIIRSVL